MQILCYSIKQTGFSVPLVPKLYKIHLIMQTLVWLLHKIVLHCELIHQPDIVIITCIVLASGWPFLPAYTKGELWNAPSQCSTAQACVATPTGNIEEASKVETPLYLGQFRWYQWCPHYRGSNVYIWQLGKHLEYKHVPMNIPTIQQYQELGCHDENQYKV